MPEGPTVDDNTKDEADGAVDKAKEWLFGTDDSAEAAGNEAPVKTPEKAPEKAPDKAPDAGAAGAQPSTPIASGANASACASPSGAAGQGASPSGAAAGASGAEDQMANTAPAFFDNSQAGGGQDDMGGSSPGSPSGGSSPGSPQAAKSSQGKKNNKAGSSSLTLAGLSASMGDMHHPKASYMAKLSHNKEAPQITMGARVASGSFFRSSSNPGPGTYSCHQNEGERQSKFTSKPRYSFGGSSRFGLGANPAKERPGPGHYGAPKDPGMEREPRVGFGGAPRQSIAGKGTLAPGPGAYEMRTCLGEGRMSTAAGRHTGSTVRARMMPGPGAYDPTDRMDSKFGSCTKVGFGTSTRADFAATRGLGPGPGTYDMHTQKVMGTGTAKFSMRSRRRLHDLASYIEPGPGHYGAHSTQFKAKEAYDDPGHYC